MSRYKSAKTTDAIEPSYGRARHFKKRFKQRVYADIAACLNSAAPVGATILICAAIDCLARYYSGAAEHVGTKKRYLEFLTRYFPNYHDPGSFYEFVRSGLLHAYNMERRFIIVGSNEAYFQKLHLLYDPKHRATIVNPFVLYLDLKQALNAYVIDVDRDPKVRKNFDKTWNVLPFEAQRLKPRSRKFAHLIETTGTTDNSDIRLHNGLSVPTQA